MPANYLEAVGENNRSLLRVLAMINSSESLLHRDSGFSGHYMLLLQSIFGALSEQGSQLAIVVSTLAIAALLSPLRGQIQDSIYRRFYRRKYDAEKSRAAFAVTARDEVDLEKLSVALLAVMEETMQAAHVSLWLAKPKRPAL